MAAREFTAEERFPLLPPWERINYENRGGHAIFTGPASALVEAWVILPEWIPPRPKRLATSHSFEGWWVWGASGETDREGRSDMLDSWDLRRLGGGVLEFVLRPVYEQRVPSYVVTADASKLHVRMVCARSDVAFRRFLIGAKAAAA